jgi:thiamine biosynthesis lipoprotein
VRVSQEVFHLIHESLQLSAQSEGAFDISFGALAPLWAPPRDGQAATLPGPAAIRQALTRVGSKHVLLDYDQTSVRLERAGMRIGLGAIAKGYAVDQVVHLLRARQVTDFIVDGGGDLYLAGRHLDRPWRVGIKDPRQPDTYFATFEARNQAVVTSGDYERYFFKDGKRYHHILDPRTGRPARGLMSVTVVQPKATLADGLATAAFVLGPRRGYDFLSRFADTEFLLVATDGQVLISPGLKARVKYRAPSTGP